MQTPTEAGMQPIVLVRHQASARLQVLYIHSIRAHLLHLQALKRTDVPGGEISRGENHHPHPHQLWPMTRDDDRLRASSKRI